VAAVELNELGLRLQASDLNIYAVLDNAAWPLGK